MASASTWALTFTALIMATDLSLGSASLLGLITGGLCLALVAGMGE